MCYFFKIYFMKIKKVTTVAFKGAPIKYTPVENPSFVLINTLF